MAQLQSKIEIVLNHETKQAIRQLTQSLQQMNQISIDIHRAKMGQVEVMSNMPLKHTGAYIDIAPECFSDGLVISYKGANYYKACDAFVYEDSEGSSSHCVKRVNHSGPLHEDYEGRTKEEDPNG